MFAFKLNSKLKLATTSTEPNDSTSHICRCQALACLPVEMVNMHGHWQVCVIISTFMASSTHQTLALSMSKLVQENGCQWFSLGCQLLHVIVTCFVFRARLPTWLAGSPPPVTHYYYYSY